MTSLLEQRPAILPHLKVGCPQHFFPLQITFLVIITLLDHIFAQQAIEKYQQLSRKSQHRSHYVDLEVQELVRIMIICVTTTFFVQKRVRVQQEPACTAVLLLVQKVTHDTVQNRIK